MKIVNNSQHKELTEYKVGMVVTGTEGIYLVAHFPVESGYTLVSLSSGVALFPYDTLAELFKAYSSPNDYEVNATLIIENITNE